MILSTKPKVHNIATTPEEDRATAIGNMHKKLVKIARVSGDNLEDRQTDTHTNTDVLITILRNLSRG